MSEITFQKWAAQTSGNGQASASKTRQSHLEESASKRRKSSVLLIEDEELIRRLLVQELKRRDFYVWDACDGNEGVRLYRELQGEIDVVLSDVNMPLMDGPQALDAVRQINPFVRWCFMTADSRESTRAGLLEMGALRVFSKPMGSVAKLAEELRELAVRSPVH